MYRQDDSHIQGLLRVVIQRQIKYQLHFTATCWPPAARNKCGGIEEEIIG